MFACNFAPTGWAMCNGQILPILQNQALFSLLGRFYGGDGVSTFALPNLQDSVAIGQGQGATLSPRSLGEQGGTAGVALLQTEMPPHAHGFNAMTAAANATTSNGNMLSKGLKGGLQASNTAKMYSTGTANTTLNPATAMAPNGGGLPHNNMMPHLVVNFCIALQGIFPPRS
jgi:microcystin-dependent protein